MSNSLENEVPVSMIASLILVLQTIPGFSTSRNRGPLLEGHFKRRREMRNIGIVTLILAAWIYAAAPAVSTSNAAYTLTVVNNSSREIRRVHIAWSGTSRWGPDRLGKDVLRPNTQVPVRDIPAGDYDLLFIDAQDNQCILLNQAIYGDRSLSIRDDWLAKSCRRR